MSKRLTASEGVFPPRLITLGLKSEISFNSKSDMSSDKYVTRMLMITCPIQRVCLIFVILVASKERSAGRKRHQSKVKTASS